MLTSFPSSRLPPNITSLLPTRVYAWQRPRQRTLMPGGRGPRVGRLHRKKGGKRDKGYKEKRNYNGRGGVVQ